MWSLYFPNEKSESPPQSFYWAASNLRPCEAHILMINFLNLLPIEEASSSPELPFEGKQKQTIQQYLPHFFSFSSFFLPPFLLE